MPSAISVPRPVRVRFQPATFALASSIAIVLFAGGYETDLELGPPESAKSDPRFVGDWDFADRGSTEVPRLVVRNFDGRQYSLAWDEAKAEPVRAAAFTAEVGGATFAHVRG